MGTIIIIAGVSLAVIMLIVGVVVSISRERAMVENRLDSYLDEEAGEVLTGGEPQIGPLTDWINTRVEGSAFAGKISRDLARADIKLKAGEYLAVVVIACFGVGAIAWFFGGQSKVFALLGVFLGSRLPKIYINRQKNGRLNHFEHQLGDMLNLVVNGLRAGFSPMQALDAVSTELPPPVSDEFRRVVQEMQLGISMENALANLLRRMDSPDLDMVVTAINVQREVGGNLAEILDTISETIRERVRLKGEIKTLTTQVVYSGRFLAMLPLILGSVLWLANRSYMMWFFKVETRIIGIPVLIIAFLMILAGYYSMTKLGDIEI